MAAKKQKSKSKSLDDDLRKAFEDDVKSKLKKEAKSLKLHKLSSHFNYGKDPQKPKYPLGPKKSLCRACSNLIRKHLSQKWIPNDCKLDFCTLSKGVNNCCYNPQQYTFGDSLNLKCLIHKAFNYDRLESNHEDISTEAMMRMLINREAEHYHLEVMINNNCSFKAYIKSATQNTIAKAMGTVQV